MSSIFRSKLEKIGLEQVRGNTNYSSGILVNGSSVVQNYLANPWIKSTTSLNAYEKNDWATAAQANKVGMAVVYRSPEGADFRTVVNPKMSFSGVASSVGKMGTLAPEIGRAHV